jgi:hypothetical protein
MMKIRSDRRAQETREIFTMIQGVAIGGSRCSKILRPTEKYVSVHIWRVQMFVASEAVLK